MTVKKTGIVDSFESYLKLIFSSLGYTNDEVEKHVATEIQTVRLNVVSGLLEFFPEEYRNKLLTLLETEVDQHTVVQIIIKLLSDPIFEPVVRQEITNALDAVESDFLEIATDSQRQHFFKAIDKTY